MHAPYGKITQWKLGILLGFSLDNMILFLDCESIALHCIALNIKQMYVIIINHIQAKHKQLYSVKNWQKINVLQFICNFIIGLILFGTIVISWHHHTGSMKDCYWQKCHIQTLSTLHLCHINRSQAQILC